MIGLLNLVSISAGATALVAGVLLIVTIILNAITLIVYRDRTTK